MKKAATLQILGDDATSEGLTTDNLISGDGDFEWHRYRRAGNCYSEAAPKRFSPKSMTTTHMKLSRLISKFRIL